MRFTKLFSAVLFSLAALTASGQSIREEIAANPNKSGGVYYVYTYDNPVLTPAPKGYKPFYISHYGRHGSRWLLHDSEYTDVMEVFDAAAAANAFTAKGRDVYDRVKRVYQDGIDRGGDLSPLGAVQHRQIAERMYGNYPEVFKGDAVVAAQSTHVVRCVLSMAAFCEGLKEQNPRLQIAREAGRRTTRYLNFFSKPTNPTLSDEYVNFTHEGPWKDDQKRMADRCVPSERMMSELFDDPAFVKTVDAQKLTLGLFYFASNMQDVDYLGISFYDLFTPEELYGLNVYDNYKYYVVRGPSPLNKRFPEYYAKVLLEDFLMRADVAVAGGEVAADLRFGHDGNVMPFLSLMQFEGCNPKETDPAKIAEMWSVYKLSPMAANIQLVFYRKKGSDDVLVKFLHNEREVKIPVASDAAPYYRWSEVRAFYRQTLDGLADPAAK
ncbi:histidine phosphatase family protein [uncultured Alistipes sp.]|jgi:hypothetical protein|uniref:histidine phosphatase family protein n=1 Tax=uncultured Alistipes sp. TaxID=538949 RepID=UPI0025F52C58|nr:histidine phosphatase family protein [uncultured Alistipes sp.]